MQSRLEAHPTHGTMASGSQPFAVPPMDGMQDLVRMRFLFDSVVTFADRHAGAVLEIGCFMGASTVVLAQACRRVGLPPMRALDLFTGTPSWQQAFDTYEICAQRLRDFGLHDDVHLVRADSRLFQWTEPLAVLHLDGDHSYQAVTLDIARYVPWLAPGGIVIFDDYDAAHPGVVRAVHELLAIDPELAVVAANNHRMDHGSLCVRRGKPGYP